MNRKINRTKNGSLTYDCCLLLEPYMEACDMFEKEKVALNNLKVGTVERPKEDGWQVDPLCTIMIERGLSRACASQKGNIPID